MQIKKTNKASHVGSGFQAKNSIKQFWKSFKCFESNFYLSFYLQHNKRNYSTILLVILRLFMNNKSHGLKGSYIWTVNLWLKMSSSKALKTSKFYSIIMTNNSVKISGNLWVSLVNFMLFFEHWEDLKSLILNTLKEKLTVSFLVGSCYLKIIESFSTVQKTMIKDTIDIDLNFRFKSS